MSTITIDVNVSDVLDEIETEDLKKELRARGEGETSLTDTERDYVEQARHALLRHDPAEALVYVELALFGRQKVAQRAPLVRAAVRP